MATLSAAEKTNLRTTQHRITPRLSVMTPTTLLTGRVNNGAIARGARSIAYDTGGGTGFATITAGMTLWVGTSAGAYDVGKVRIKAIAGNQAAGTITIAENGIDWVDDLYLTVLWNYEIWAIPPSTRSGVFYKDYDVTYSGQNAEPPPVAIAGSHRAGELVAGSLAFTIDGSASYAVADGAAITTYLWTVAGPAAAVITNANIATTTITYDTAGIYWLKLTVTDDNGKSQSTYRAHFVHDSGYPAYRNVSIGSISGDWNTGGWSASLEVFGDVELSDFPDGALVVLWSENYYADIEAYVNLWGVSNEVLMAGYIQTESDGDDLDSGDGSVSFTVNTPEAVLAKRSEMGTISIEATAAPTTWYEYASWLTVGRAIHHLLKWHSTALETCDIYGLLDNTLGVFSQSFVQESILAMVNGFAFENGIFAKLASDRLGRLHLVEDSQMFEETVRAAMDTVFELAVIDLSGNVSLARDALKQTALAFLDGFTFDGTTNTALSFIIPGYPDGAINLQMPEIEGSGSINKTRQVLDDQADGEMKTGRVLAAANNPLRELRSDMRGNYSGAFDIIPSIGWYDWGIADNVFKRNLSLNGTRWLCRRVELSLPVDELFTGDLVTSVTLEGEAFGPDGLLSDYPSDYPTPTLPAPNWTPAALVGGGYFAGGFNAVNYYDTTDKIVFSTGVTAAQASADLSGLRFGIAGLSDTATYGYFGGGYDDGLNILDTTDRVTFATDTTAANAASALSTARAALAGLSDGSTYGYWAGGNDGAFNFDIADIITFGTGVTAANAVSDLTAGKIDHTTLSDGSTYGYWVAGRDDLGSLDQVDTIDRITFGTGVTAATIDVVSVARYSLAGVSDGSTYGYVAGGLADSGGVTYYATADRMTFGTGTVAANAVSNLSGARSTIAPSSDGATYGYFAGGYQAGYVTTTDRISFSTGVTAVNADSALSVGRATQNGGNSSVAV